MNKKLKIHDGDTPGKVFEVKLEYPKPKETTMSNQNKQAEYICSRCGSKGWVIGYDNGTIIKCPCCSAVWMENVVL